MKAYVIFFLTMKVALLIQFILILFRRQTRNSIVYILTEIIFKTALFLFIEWFTFHNDFGINLEDKLIISFGGGILFYDACFNDLPHLIDVLRDRGDIPPWLNSIESIIKHLKSLNEPK